jgi:hypothetical protein
MPASGRPAGVDLGDSSQLLELCCQPGIFRSEHPQVFLIDLDVSSQIGVLVSQATDGLVALVVVVRRSAPLVTLPSMPVSVRAQSVPTNSNSAPFSLRWKPGWARVRCGHSTIGSVCGWGRPDFGRPG